MSADKSGCETPGWMELRPDRMAAVRYPDKRNVGEQNSGYEISGWNEGEFRLDRMCDATRQKGGDICVSKKEEASGSF